MYSYFFSTMFCYINNLQFLACFTIMGIIIQVTHSFKLSNFFDFILFLIITLVLSGATYGFVKMITVINDIIVSQGKLEEIKIESNTVYLLEKRRIAILKEFIKLFFLVIPFIMWFMFNLESPSGKLYYFGYVFSFVLIFAFGLINGKVQFEKNKIINSFKNSLLLDLLNEEFSDVKLNINAQVAALDIINSGMLKGVNNFTGNDLIEARKKDILFSFSDVKARKGKRVSDRHGNRKLIYEDKFQGTVIKIKDVPFRSRIIVTSKNFENVTNVFTKFDKFIGLENDTYYETESFGFNEQFKVFAIKEKTFHEAINSYAIDRINYLSELIQNEFALLFFGEHLYIIISTPNVDNFEISLTSGDNMLDVYNKSKAHVKLISEIIDNLPVIFESPFEGGR